VKWHWSTLDKGELCRRDVGCVVKVRACLVLRGGGGAGEGVGARGGKREKRSAGKEVGRVRGDSKGAPVWSDDVESSEGRC